MDHLKTDCKFVGCHRVIRKCYHCGYEVEMLVLDGCEITEPNPDDYCIGKKHHEDYDANPQVLQINIKGKPKQWNKHGAEWMKDIPRHLLTDHD